MPALGLPKISLEEASMLLIMIDTWDKRQVNHRGRYPQHRYATAYREFCERTGRTIPSGAPTCHTLCERLLKTPAVTEALNLRAEAQLRGEPVEIPVTQRLHRELTESLDGLLVLSRKGACGVLTDIICRAMAQDLTPHTANMTTSAIKIMAQLRGWNEEGKEESDGKDIPGLKLIRLKDIKSGRIIEVSDGDDD